MPLSLKLPERFIPHTEEPARVHAGVLAAESDAVASVCRANRPNPLVLGKRKEFAERQTPLDRRPTAAPPGLQLLGYSVGERWSES